MNTFGVKKRIRFRIHVVFMIVWICLCKCSLCCLPVNAADSTKDNKEIAAYQSMFWSQYDFGEIDQWMKQMFPAERMQFSDLLKELLSGNSKTILEGIKRFSTERLFYQFRYHKTILVQMILIALFSAFFQSFSVALGTKQLSNTGFYVLYMILLTLSIHSFESCITLLSYGMDQLIQFMRVLCPSFFLSVAIAVGANSSLLFYNVVLFVIYTIEWVSLKVLFPMVHIYIIILFLNELSEEHSLTQMAEFIEKIISSLLKISIALVVGLNMIQGLISPVLDYLKRDLIVKTTANIPGVGDVISNGTELLMGVAMLFKNSIGMGGMIVILVLSLSPILEIGIVSFLYKAAAAFVQPVADKRIVGCISSMSNGCNLLLKIQFTMTLLFLLMIAMIVAATAKGY